MKKINRRTVIQGIGASALTPFINSCGKNAVDTATPLPEFGWELLRERIDTVVILMMENRSFDHYFGARKLEEGDSRIDGLTADMSNPHPGGYDVTPFLSETFCLPDPPHGWTSCHDQFNDGANDGFVTEYYPHNPNGAEEAMGYWSRETLSTLWTLADHYTLCDQWFSSVMSSTWPNRFYSLCGQNGGYQGNDFPDESFPSILTMAAEAGYDWSTYYNNLPFVILLPDVAINDDTFRSFDDFQADAEAGKLPPITIVEPVYGRDDDHPPTHPVAGQVFMALVYDILSKSPQWERTLFIITYDEHGGFFDHVPPPTATDDREEDGFGQLGFRVPTLVMGPWVKPNHVSSVTYDHTSMMAFIENLLELEPLTTRDAAADPMLDVFDQDALINNAPHTPIDLPTIEADEDEIYNEACSYLPNMSLDGITFQPELEAFVVAHPDAAFIDRRSETNRMHQDIVEAAVKRGLLTLPESN